MSPFVHGMFYAEPDGVTLGSRELRILVDPRTVSAETADHLRDIDVLRHYLREVPGQPCTISLLAPPASPTDNLVRQLFEVFNVQVLPVGDVSSLDVRSALDLGGTEHPELVALAATAAAADVDVVLTLEPAATERADAFKEILHVAVADWAQAMRTCETFTRGHEVPWAFSYPMWWWPWSVFYSLAEPRQGLMDFHRRVFEAKRFDDGTVEYLRSLTLNRHAMLSYTRDKLLFYVLQRRAAARRGFQRQEYLLEVAYFLNHFYVLLWGGLDQLALALNGLFQLGQPERRVGFQNTDFQKALGRKAGTVAALFERADFRDWVKVLAAARHFCAHRGVVTPMIVLLQDREITAEELDRKVEAHPMWQHMVGILGREKMDQWFRSTWRIRVRMEEFEKVSEPGFEIELDGSKSLFFPLMYVEWDFAMFFQFVEDVVAETQRTLGLSTCPAG